MLTQPINSKIPDTNFQAGDTIKCIEPKSDLYGHKFVIVGFVVEDNDDYAMIGKLDKGFTKEEIQDNLWSDYDIKVSTLNKYFVKVEGE